MNVGLHACLHVLHMHMYSVCTSASRPRGAVPKIGAVPDLRRCLVVGAGLLGLAAAWAMTRRGWEVLVLEAAGAPGHEGSGSKGDARIFRLGYPDPLYVEMAFLARARWRDLEARTGRRLLSDTGQVTLGDEPTLEAIATALTAAGAPVERVSATDAAQRLPGIAAAGSVLVEPDSGVLAADQCLVALLQAGSIDVRNGHPVTALRQTPDAVTVRTADGAELRGVIAIVCAGPATLELAGLGTPTALSAPSLPQVAYFASRSDEGEAPPIFIEWGDDMVYGLPVPTGGPHAGLYKVAQHVPGPALSAFDPTDPAPFAMDDPALLDPLTNAVARLLPSLDPHPVATERCVYDNSSDTDFVLERVGRVVVGCGTSGHAFKFGPLLGELLADLAEGTRPPVDLSRFALARPVAPAHEPGSESGSESR
jgi:sarcosine oxidase